MSADDEVAILVAANRQRMEGLTREGEEVEDACRAVVDGLIALRKRRGLSQNQTSKRAGISQRGINMIESGTRSPSLRSIIKMARGLDATVVMSEGEVSVHGAADRI